MADYELGCPEYTIMVQSRCGSYFFCALKGVNRIRYNRILNEVSGATIEVAMSGSCCQCVGEINPWEHEIGIYRGNSLVWVGPIIDIDIDMSTQMVTIECKDLLTWADHRLIELADTDYEPEGTDLGDAYSWVLNHAYCKQPWCMTWSIDNVGTPAELWIPAFDQAGGDRWGGQYINCGDRLRELSQAGIDFTVIGRHLWGGSVAISNPVASGIILLDSSFRTTPNIKVAGSKMVTRQVSAGGQGGHEDGWYDDQIWISPDTPRGPITPSLLNGNQTKYGLLEQLTVTQLYDEVDTTVVPNALKDDAESQIALLSQPYIYITGGVLDRKAPMTMEEHLIPGAVIQVGIETTCRPITENLMRLTNVDVSYDSESGEEVSISLSPVGRT